ncbi:hypothetical protein [Stenotrophomonas maltophilia]|uniref:hypothetical protein n=1 Tax=Stenotrophomonas maltophilia TaxID=40324 RepID=UPI0011B46178|nr:hypothetical protein [Stenotrophomonas maltophilia]
MAVGSLSALSVIAISLDAATSLQKISYITNNSRKPLNLQDFSEVLPVNSHESASWQVKARQRVGDVGCIDPMYLIAY